jgi:hypothetical protein
MSPKLTVGSKSAAKLLAVDAAANTAINPCKNIFMEDLLPQNRLKRYRQAAVCRMPHAV